MRARDAAGNLDATPATRTWTVSTGGGGSTFTFSPDADARVVEASPTTNYGTSSNLEADASPLVESYIRFNVSGLDGPVGKAELKLYVNLGPVLSAARRRGRRRGRAAPAGGG